MKILVVEDDELIAQTLSAILSMYRYAVEVVNDGQSALEMLEAFEFDVVLLDIILPKLSGLEVCKQARAKGIQVPILMLTARDSSQDKAAGLDAGADDYLVKPFDHEELIARVRALFRRGRRTQPSMLNFGELTLEPESCEVKYDQKNVRLTPKEYSMLELFLRNPTRVYSCGMILEHVWTHEETPGEEAVRTHIKGLRQKLKSAGGDADLITTVYGIGYRLKSQSAFPLTQDQKERPNATTESSSPGQQIKNEMNQRIDELWKTHQTTIAEQVNLIEVAVEAAMTRSLSMQSREIAIRNAHSLAGSLGTFDVQAGSKIARSIEMMLMAETVLVESDVQQLKRWINGLRQAIEEKSFHLPERPTEPLRRNMLLLFEPDRKLADQLRTGATQMGYIIQSASSLKNAITLVENILPTAIILDPMMGADREKVAEFFEEIEALDVHIPVVIFTEQSSSELEYLSKANIAQSFKKSASIQAVLQGVQTAIKQIQGTEATILAVDDDSSILALLKVMLEPWGMAVQTLSEPRQFFPALELVRPDLIILDVEMPDYNGIELCKMLRSRPDWAEVPVLFLTVHGNEEIINEIFRSGADDYIQKPFVGPELVTRILNRLERNRLLRRLASSSSQLALGLGDSPQAGSGNQKTLESQLIPPIPGLISDLNNSDRFPQAVVNLLNIADDAIICIDHQQNIVFFNRGAEKIFGYSADEILGHALNELIPERYGRVHRQHVETFRSDQRGAKQMGERQEIYGQRKGGIEFPSEASIAKYGQGNQTLYTVILRDISERKQAEQKKSDFVAVVSHQLRTPLTGVVGVLEMLSRGLQSQDSEESDKLLSIAMSSAERLVRLVNSVLDIERIEIGKVELNLAICDLAEIAEDAVKAMQSLASSRGIILEMTLHPVKARVDRNRIFQVLTNLMSNAIHFSGEGMTVSLRLTTDKHLARVEVIDRGTGISPEQIEHIFEKFHQSELPHPGAHSGLGLGLATCQSIIKQHDGAIWVESQLGVGSHFFFTLPRSED